ncbi:unnamed protein product [Larinioides sclopetarius]|uniref:Uncharacterized protein n=1 Tax=Larinioides sclopetarius TaxID=280406 RepID=A0AAV1ZU86_9ARAC
MEIRMENESIKKKRLNKNCSLHKIIEDLKVSKKTCSANKDVGEV